MNRTNRHLLAAMPRWARANGWERAAAPRCWRRTDWTAEVSWTPDGHMSVTLLDRHAWNTARRSQVDVTSVQQAADVLAALGLLPATFSSIYRFGRAAGWRDGVDAILHAAGHEQRAGAAC
ncbi:MAG TPA: hypothetical protein VE326_11235 [Candidatus Binatia bacterium]|nr:hypothetical protein [Candidatus Binatia bacterium]